MKTYHDLLLYAIEELLKYDMKKAQELLSETKEISMREKWKDYPINF